MDRVDYGKLGQIMPSQGWTALYCKPETPYVFALEIVGWVKTTKDGIDRVVAHSASLTHPGETEPIPAHYPDASVNATRDFDFHRIIWPALYPENGGIYFKGLVESMQRWEQQLLLGAHADQGEDDFQRALEETTYGDQEYDPGR